MSTKYLRKIILEEIKNVLSEGLGQDNLGLEDQPGIPGLTSKTFSGKTAASEPYETAMKAQTSGLQSSPVGNLQAYLRYLNQKVSNLPGNKPDGIVGPDTLQAIKNITGKNYSKEYVNKNARLVSQEVGRIAREKGIDKGDFYAQKQKVPGFRPLARGQEVVQIKNPQTVPATTGPKDQFVDPKPLPYDEKNEPGSKVIKKPGTNESLIRREIIRALREL